MCLYQTIKGTLFPKSSTVGNIKIKQLTFMGIGQTYNQLSALNKIQKSI